MSTIRAKKSFVIVWAVGSTAFFYAMTLLNSDTWSYLVGYVPSLPLSVMLQPLAAFVGGAGGVAGSLIAGTFAPLFAGACTGSAIVVAMAWWGRRGEAGGGDR